MKKTIIMGAVLALAIAGGGTISAFVGYMAANSSNSTNSNNFANSGNSFMQEATPFEDKDSFIADDSQVGLYGMDGEVAGNGGSSSITGMRPDNKSANSDDSFMQDANPFKDKDCVIADGSQVSLYDVNGEPVKGGGSSFVTGMKPND